MTYLTDDQLRLIEYDDNNKLTDEQYERQFYLQYVMNDSQMDHDGISSDLITAIIRPNGTVRDPIALQFLVQFTALMDKFLGFDSELRGQFNSEGFDAITDLFFNGCYLSDDGTDYAIQHPSVIADYAVTFEPMG